MRHDSSRRRMSGMPAQLGQGNMHVWRCRVPKGSRGMQAGIRGLVATFTPEGWAQALPGLAAALAQLGPSLRGGLHLASSLEAACPRERLLRQHLAARVLLSVDFCQVSTVHTAHAHCATES